jgi:putative protease
MPKIEILAPAGGFDSLVAAVRSGADAVYVGEKSFSARASAQNFDAEELKRAAAYCHIHGVKIYVTINTIVFDDELQRLKEAVLAAARADVDALIVQNLGVARLAKQLVPQLALHASTQMSVHTAAGVRALYEMGFKRVVLSREMSKQEIAKAAQVPVELEVFVHGALCMCVSGQCYFSAMLGSRSGNRGACAQTCRLPFSVGSEKGGHALSLKDNSLINHIGELEEMGVASAKIEGRMKRPEYVAAAVKACKEQRDCGFVSEKTAETLRGVFSRTGFTDGYFTGRLGKEMFGTRTKEDVVSADEKLFSAIRQSYKDELRNVKINGRFSAIIGKNPVLEISDGTHRVKKIADIICEKALKLPLSVEKCTAQLSKTGGTAYLLENLDLELDDEVSVPLSVLNLLRREALAELDEKRAVVHNYEINDFELPAFPKHKPNGNDKLRVRVADTKLSPIFRQAQLVFVPLFARLDELKRLLDEGYKIGVEVPRGMFGREDSIRDRLESVKELGICDVLCHNIGALYLAKSLKMRLHGGFGLNLVNTLDLLWAEEYGLCDVELSFELDFQRINALGGKLERGIITQGYLPLMLCRNCPNKSVGIDCQTCKNQSKMTDRKGEKFFLKCDGNCTEVLNCVPLYIAEEEFSKLSTDFHVLLLNVENYVENVENIEDLQELNSISMLKYKFTRGLYKRGVN